jgi:hypothetical protein
LHNMYQKLGVKNRTALAALLNGYRLDWTYSSSTASEFRGNGIGGHLEECWCSDA